MANSTSNDDEREGRATAAGASARTDGLQSLSTGLRIIEFFARHDQSFGVTQVANALGLPKARVHRYLSTLRNLGYLIQDQSSEQYRTGWSLYILSQDVRHNFSMARAARPFMESVCGETGMTIVLSTYTEREFVVLNFVAPPSPLELGLRPGSRFALNAGAQGKIALAFAAGEVLDSFLDQPLTAYTPETITDAAALHAEVGEIRARKWADAPDQLFLGVNAVAVPIFSYRGHLVGALAAVGMTSALPSPPPDSVVEALGRSAGELSQLLGFDQG